MSACAGCRHWQRDEWSDPDAYDLTFTLNIDENQAEALVAPQAGRWGICARIRHGWGGSARAYTLDASDYASSLRTRDDFGCIEWAEQDGDR